MQRSRDSRLISSPQGPVYVPSEPSQRSCLIGLIERDKRGQGLAEYALILALIAVLAIAAVTFLGGQINSILSSVGNAI